MKQLIQTITLHPNYIIHQGIRSLFVMALIIGLGSISLPVRAIDLRDNGDSTVTDWDTGLTWQQRPNIGPPVWTAAQAYCYSLLLSNGGWRLPNVKELASIVDRSTDFPAINTVYFPGTRSFLYWTVSSNVTFNSNAYVVDFDDGKISVYAKANDAYVRCVR